MNKVLTCFSLLLVLFSITGSNVAEASGYTKLFTLERTLNANQVVYEADLSNTDMPIHPYWNMLASDGHTEELTRLERNRAYGVEILDQSSTEVKFAIKAFTSHPLIVRLDPVTQAPYAVISLDSGEKILSDIFLTLTGGIFPGVSKVDVTFQDSKDGPLLKESFDPHAQK